MIKFKTPRFWFEKSTSSILIANILRPFSWIYLLVFCFKKKLSRPKKVNLPVICVGNLTAGGAGKTPTALAIGKILQEMGIEFCYLSRGYGGDSLRTSIKSRCEEFLTRFSWCSIFDIFPSIATHKTSKSYLSISSPQNFEKAVKPTRCNEIFFERNSLTDAKNFGDEPLLLNELAPVMLAKNRYLAAQKIAEMKKFQAIILDDGLQHFGLFQDLRILVIDGKIGFGNALALPAGALRQSLSSGFKDADLVFVVGKPSEELSSQLKKYNKLAPLFEIEVIAQNIDKFQNEKLFAFCGLAYPQKFFSYLISLGLKLVKTKSFADHYFFNEEELSIILSQAEDFKGIAIATKKDWVKFPRQFQQKIAYLDINFEIKNKDLLARALSNLI